MAHVQPVDRQTFLENVRQSGLLDADRLAAAAEQLPADAKSKRLARAFIKQGLLTRFQAERLLIGRSTGFFLNQYRILDQLGRGGMGRVYKAEHRTMNRVVALKVLAPSLLQTDRAQDLFQREVRTVARLVHPNIVTAFDANHIADRYYLVMEFVDGPNLDQLVRKQGPLPVGQACEFVRQIAHGLQYAHEMGMVHRDIKPANILVQQSGDGRGSSGVVKISDFGLARLQEATTPDDEGMGSIVTKENTVMGTPDYLSPEQARSLHKVDIRSDLYSLGCTFYFLLTGNVPFPGGNALEKLIRHSTESPVPVEQHRADLPPEVLAILHRLLEKNPEDRFQTPAELASALEPFAATDSSTWKTARPNSSPYTDGLATPVLMEAGSSEEIHELSASDEIAALAGTLPIDFSPTPLSITTLPAPSRLSRVIRREQRKRFTFALLWATLIVGGMLAVLALVGFLLSGR